MTTKPSERIVVFVTPAQKLAVSKAADAMGISVSELMRRAMLNFTATSEQIKAASIVDRLRAPKQPDALDVALKSVAAKAAAREAKEAAAQATRDAAKSVKSKRITPASSDTEGEDASITGDGHSS
jgi:hypothetical protein